LPLCASPCTVLFCDRKKRVILYKPKLLMLAALILMIGLLPVGVSKAQTPSPPIFQTLAAQVIVVDAESGAVLFEKNANALMAPASMAKIMTAEIVFRELAEGRLQPDSEMTVSENAWRKGGAPSGGSAMFAALNSRIKVLDLLQGLIVQSGNDAAIVLAEGIAGTEEQFASLMTQRAREIGLTQSIFKNATGFGEPAQKTTARELALLALHILRTYPEFYKIFGQKEFTWNKISQQNRNPLLLMDIGADGLKTGNIEESGFGLVGSAVQNGQRLILVVNGLKTARDRALEARKMLEWGFRSFESRLLFDANKPIGSVKLFGGTQSSLQVAARRPVRIFIPRGNQEPVKAQIIYKGPIMAPVTSGTEIGILRIMRGENEALNVPVYAAETIEQGSLMQRAWDGLMEGALNLMRPLWQR
jgi:serine-type D-Ala-D-Ala carboxypeptidase (penicillin-binding protein 5/6)